MGSIDLNKLNQTFGEMMARAENPSKPLSTIGEMMADNMKQNIDEGGRPTPFIPSKRVLKFGGQTLRNTGDFRNSMTWNLVNDGHGVEAGPGSASQAFAAILNYGKAFPWRKGQKKGSDFPARDYIYQPPESYETFGQVLQNFVLYGL